MPDCQTIASEMARLKRGISRTMPDNPVLSGWAAYSQCDEDGIIRECLRRIEGNTPLSRTFVEVGCGNGLENNTHLLLLEGFRGVWVDGDEGRVRQIEAALGGSVFERLWVLEAVVALDSAERLGQRAGRFLGAGSVDLFSLDIDGNDWHVLPAFLESLNPKLVCVEYNAKFPPPSRLVMHYNEAHVWQGGDYFGASLQSWIDLLETQGYGLVCCNLSGANAFFVRNDLLQGFTRYPSGALHQPPRYALVDAPKGHPATLSWAKQAVEKVDHARFVPATHGSNTFSLAIHAGTDRFISGDIAREGIWEPFETAVFSRLCRPGDFVLDLGANIGWYSVLAADLVGAEGRVLAFEPDEGNARLFEMNAAIADVHCVVELQRSAVGACEEAAPFYRSDTNLGDHRLFSDGSSRASCTVEVITLDAFFSGGHPKLPDIVKSDTQGSEARILKGAQRLFSRGWRPVMILEFWPFGLDGSGDDPLRLWQELVGLGYVSFELVEAHPRLVPICFERLRSRLASDISPASGGFINILCIQEGSDRLPLVADLIAGS